MKVNIKMISELTGFSPATVSNALNNKRGVSRETAERVLSVAREYGYTQGAKINKIKFVMYKREGVVVTNTPFFSAVMDGVEIESREQGLDTTFCNLNWQDPDFIAVRDQLINDSESAILLLATEMQEEDIKPFESALAPVVVLDNWFEEMTFNSVLISNTDSVYGAVRHLISKGHKRIGYLQGSIRIKNFFYRDMGYRRAMTISGLTVNPEYTFSLMPTMEGAYKDMKEALKLKPELPTAFFADNDMIALGAMRALQEDGHKIPRDVSIVGFDDLPYSAISYPSLTTVRVPKEEMGCTAVRVLIRMMKSDTGVKAKIQMCSNFIERDSIRDLNT